MNNRLDIFEKIWSIVFILLILLVTLYASVYNTDYNNLYSIFLNLFLSPLSALTGIICVLLAAKGKISNYIWGFINCFTYAYLSFISGYYGDMILNIFWFVPMQFVGYYLWKQRLHKNSNTDVKMKKLALKKLVILAIICSVFCVSFGLLLSYVDNWLTDVLKINSSIYSYIESTTGFNNLGEMLDASTEILQITATLLMVYAYKEQWIMWILTNVISLFLWIVVLIADISMINFVLPIIIMWFAYLTNSIYGYYRWTKGSNELQGVTNYV